MITTSNFSAGHYEENSGLSYKSANDLVKMFVKNGILNEIIGKNRNRYYRMEKYFNLFSKE